MRLRVGLATVVLMLLAPVSLPAATGSVNVAVRIDGVSDLSFSLDSAWWYHMQYDPPGTTTINGVSWIPTGLSNGCSCTSNTFSGVTPPIPATATNFQVVVNDGRGVVTIEETPSSSNGYELRVRFDDGPFGGADDYDVTVLYQYATVETPATSRSGLIALLAMLAILGMWAARG
jgi:hypothetical protein